MKRVFFFCVVFFLTIVLPGVPGGAVEDPAVVDVWVEIEGGGTALITTEDSSPLPDQSRLVVGSEKMLSYHLEFPSVGTYSYSVQVEPDGRDILYDETEYQLYFYVTDEDGELIGNVVIYRAGESSKYVPDEGCMLAFSNKVPPDEPGKTETPEPSAPGTGTGRPPESPQDTGGRMPKTGDNFRPELYLAVAAGLSALFLLAVSRYFRARRSRQ